MLSHLEVELESQVLFPQGGDERIAAFCQAILHMLKVSELSKIIEDAAEWRGGFGAHYLLNLLLRAFQKQCMRYEDGYPLAYTSVQMWKGAIERVLEIPNRREELRSDLFHCDIQSNVVERYKACKLVMHLLADKIGKHPIILDAGCSRNLGLKKLALNLPFNKVSCGIQDNDKFPHVLLDKLFDELLDKPISLSYGQGADITDIGHDPDDSDWSRACSFYPSELLNTKQVTEFDFLNSIVLENISFVQADFTAEGLPNERLKKYDVITVSTFLYQLSSVERIRARTLFRKYLTDKGVIIYQDFISTTLDRRQLQFETNWLENLYPYRTIVEFAEDKSAKLYELLRWENGRCAKWVPGKDLQLTLNNR